MADSIDKRTFERLTARDDEFARDYRQRLTAHRGMATWGEKLVPLAEFREAAAASGRQGSEQERQEALEAYLRPRPDSTPVEGPYSRVAVFGGVYNNHLALEALLEDATRRGAEAIYCLGDLGGFGPSPEKVWPLLEEGAVRTIQGNYEQSLSSGREDCNCGYADPRDNHFAEVSYRYTEAGCSEEFKAYMGSLPLRRRIQVGHRELLLVHGSPRRINEFLFDSASPQPFLEALLAQNDCSGILCTHTGLHWHRAVEGGDVVNVGVIGRPANDGVPHVHYAFLEERDEGVSVDLLPLRYDYQSLAEEMRQEKLPDEFVETILSGWWTTCLEVLPPRERAVSRF